MAKKRKRRVPRRYLGTFPTIVKELLKLYIL
jgi:hypothetical protein